MDFYVTYQGTGFVNSNKVWSSFLVQKFAGFLAAGLPLDPK